MLPSWLLRSIGHLFWGRTEFAHTSLLKLTFQLRNSNRDRTSRMVHHTISKTSSSMGSGLQCRDQNVGLVLTNSADLVSPLSHVPKYFLIPIRKKMMPNSLGSRRMLRMVVLDQAGLQKRFLRNPMNSVHRAAIQNRSWPFLGDSEYSSVDWERGDTPDLLAVSGS